MLLGYNTNGLQNHRLSDALRLLADHGYEAVALTPDIQHLDPFTVGPKEVDAIAALLEKLGLHVSIETGARFLLDPSQKHEPTLMTRDAEARAKRVEFLRSVAQMGRDLGAEVVSFFSGIDRGDSDTAQATLMDGVSAACMAVRSMGMTPALEPEPGMVVATVADYLALRDALPDSDSRPSLCLDIGHLYATGEGLAHEVLPGVEDLLVQVHLEDMRRGVHDHLLPGDGDVDFSAVYQALLDHGYGGPVCFELSRSSHMAPHAIQVCHDVWQSCRR